jgi:hypothetical protein
VAERVTLLVIAHVVAVAGIGVEAVIAAAIVAVTDGIEAAIAAVTEAEIEAAIAGKTL